MSEARPHRNRVDPWGDLHAVGDRGLFTGNRGCLVDGDGETARHHRGQRWIVCLTRYRDWRQPLARPGSWTPIFFLDEAVALSAGHRPCAMCRRQAHETYRGAVASARGEARSISASDLDRLLASERHLPGRGMERRSDRVLWKADITHLPSGTVIVVGGRPHLLLDDRLLGFHFAGWKGPRRRPEAGVVEVLTPPTSVGALAHGYVPVLHPSAAAT